MEMGLEVDSGWGEEGEALVISGSLVVKGVGAASVGYSFVLFLNKET